MKIRLTPNQGDLMSRAADSLRNGLQGAAKDPSLAKSAVSRSEVNDRIWQEVSKARQAAGSTKLNQVGDDAQLANVDMQNVLQKQQQTLQMMSNISKTLHDTAAAVIRKMGG